VGLAGVLERVGQRFLDDPVGGQLAPDRELARLALELEMEGWGRRIDSGGASFSRAKCLQVADRLGHSGRLPQQPAGLALVGAVVHHSLKQRTEVGGW
jgi:hypothetical protein